MPQQVPQIGEDVTALMGGGPPPVGADVTHLMQDTPQPDFQTTNATDAQGHPVVSGEDFSRFGPMQSLLKDQAQGGAPSANTVIEGLPAILGTVTSILGGSKALPTGMTTAALGGSIGESSRQVLQALRGRMDLVPPTASAQLQSIGTQAALQGGAEAVGRGAQTVLGQGARKVYGGVLKLKDTVANQFPGVDVVGEALQNNALITRRGAAAMKAKMQAARADAMQAVTDADAAGSPGVSLRETVSAFPEVVKTLRSRADVGMKNELPEVGRRGRALARLADRSGGGIPLPAAQAYKETAQKSARGAYRKITMGTKGELSAKDLLNVATATGLQKGLEQQVKGLATKNAKTQALLAVTKALKDAVKRESKNNAIGMRDLIAVVGGGGAFAATDDPKIAALVGAMARLTATPSTGSAIAIGMNKLARFPASHLLRATQLALIEETKK